MPDRSRRHPGTSAQRELTVQHVSDFFFAHEEQDEVGRRRADLKVVGSIASP